MTNGARNAAFESEKSAVALCPSIFLFLNGVPDILMSGFFFTFISWLKFSHYGLSPLVF